MAYRVTVFFDACATFDFEDGIDQDVAELSAINKTESMLRLQAWLNIGDIERVHVEHVEHAD